MAAKKNRSTPATRARAQKGAASDAPSLFRINVEVGNLDQAVDFYSTLLGITGRKQAGSRCYFTCGPVTLQVVDVSSVAEEDVHHAPGKAISVRPWGERSFYAEDKWANPLCFVQAGTIYPG